MNKITAPIAKKEKHILTQHEESRNDEYYWMRLSDEQKTAEQLDAHAQEVVDYLNAENDYTQAMLKHTAAFQETLFQEIIGRIKQDDESVPYFKNGYWYYVRYEEGKEYPFYCRKKASLDAEEELLLNVNELAEGAAYFQLGSMSVSPDNQILAYSVDTVSRRIYKVYFKNLITGELFEDVIEGTTGAIAWANDNQTVFYTLRNEVTLLSEKIMRHKLGNNEDVLVYQEQDSSYYIGVYRSKSGKYIIIWNSSTLSSDYWILQTDNPDGKFKNFLPRTATHEYDVLHFEDKFYIRTNWNAQNFRLMEVAEQDTANQDQWKEVIPHQETVYLEDVELFKKFMVIGERVQGLMKISILNQETKEKHYLDFADEAYTAVLSTNPEFDTDILRYSYASMTTPNSTYDYNMNTKVQELKKRQEVVGGHDPEAYESKRLWVKARDGQQIPVSIVYKKGFSRNADAPLLLYAYGSYGHTVDAYFSSVRLSLLDRGFAFAIAHIRGGQMLGRQWYDDGKVLNKMNTFNDFIDCAEYLIEHQYTHTNRLFAMGGSAGGLLMGAVANLAGHLFKGMVAAVPFVDVLTTMSDPTIPLTTNEYDEWGNPENKAHYDYIKAYSPYDQVGRQDYPNILVTTGLHDSQVQYWEPAKWVAKLRDYKTDNNVLLLHTNMEAGHGGASGRFRRFREVALEYAFLLDLANCMDDLV